MHGLRCGCLLGGHHLRRAGDGASLRSVLRHPTARTRANTHPVTGEADDAEVPQDYADQDEPRLHPPGANGTVLARAACLALRTKRPCDVQKHGI